MQADLTHEGFIAKFKEGPREHLIQMILARKFFVCDSAVSEGRSC